MWLFSLGENFAEIGIRLFTWGLFSRFQCFSSLNLIKVLFSRGVNFHDLAIIMKNTKITPAQKFPRLQ